MVDTGPVTDRLSCVRVIKKLIEASDLGGFYGLVGDQRPFHDLEDPQSQGSIGRKVP